MNHVARRLTASLCLSALACRTPTEITSPRARTVPVADGLETELVGFPSTAVAQETLVWCWAACAEMILRFNGVETTQAEIAARIHGTDDGGELKLEMAGRYEIMHALNPDLERTAFEAVWKGLQEQVQALPASSRLTGVECRQARAFDLALDRLAPSKAVVIDQLRGGEPAVVGLRDPDAESGHAYVLFGAAYSERRWSPKLLGFLDELWKPAGADSSELEIAARSMSERFAPERYTVREVRLIDPADGSQVSLPIEEFAARVDFVLTKPEARQVLEAFENVVLLEQEPR
jgi:hypothetical protein